MANLGSTLAYPVAFPASRSPAPTEPLRGDRLGVRREPKEERGRLQLN